MTVEINEKGLSIVGVVIALSVIIVGLMGVLSLVLQNIQVQGLNKNYLVASMLAQEGLELVRNIRDTNFLKGYNWKSDIVHGGSYTIDYNLSIQSAANISVDQTKLYLNGNQYTHTTGSILTPYRRLITVVEYGDDYVEVHSLVQWSEHQRTHNYEAVTNLYDWW